MDDTSFYNEKNVIINLHNRDEGSIPGIRVWVCCTFSCCKQF